MSLPLTNQTSQPGGHMTGAEAPTWRERALTYYRQAVRIRQMEASRERAAQARWLGEILTPLLDERITCEGPRVTLDGSTFAVRRIDGESSLHLVGCCPRCGQEALSHPIWTLADLGGLLDTFSVGYDHRCPDREPAPAALTDDERLAAVLRDLIDERIELALSTRGEDA
jgi:hypothetical protein